MTASYNELVEFEKSLVQVENFRQSIRLIILEESIYVDYTRPMNLDTHSCHFVIWNVENR